MCASHGEASSPASPPRSEPGARFQVRCSLLLASGGCCGSGLGTPDTKKQTAALLCAAHESGVDPAWGSERPQRRSSRPASGAA